jgi:uncharacterized protein (DUF1778 family)
MPNRTKTATLNIRIKPELKELIDKRAEEESRTVTSYIEWLVKKDAAEHQD